MKVLVDEHGPKKWALIASVIKTKSSKQCRRRWKNVLDMDAKTTTWSSEEDARLVQYHRELGNKWTQISRRFGDRTDNAVKNRWHALCRKQPDLAEEESPVTIVGVRRGTRTRRNLDPDSSEDSYLPRSKRARGSSGHGSIPREISAGVSGGAQQSLPSGGPSWGGPPPPRSRSGPLELPTPFDQQHQLPMPGYPAPLNLVVNKVRTPPPCTGSAVALVAGMNANCSILPVTKFELIINRIVQGALSRHDLRLANQLNSKGLPVHIEVTELGGAPARRGLTDPAFSFGAAPSLPDLHFDFSMQQNGMRIGSGAAGFPNLTIGSGAGMPASAFASEPGLGQSLSLGELINWLNSTSASGLPPAATHPTAPTQIQGQGSAQGAGRGAPARRMTRMGSGVLNRAPSAQTQQGGANAPGAGGMLELSRSSSSGGLNSEQRELLCRLISHARDSVDALHAGKPPGLGDGPQLTSVPSLGLGSLNMSMGLSQFGRTDPLGRTRSASTSGRSGGWAEAAAAAIAAVDQALQPAGGSGGSGLTAAAPLSRRPSSRDRKGGTGSGSGQLAPNASAVGGMAEASDVMLIAPSLSVEDIDMLIDALAFPKPAS